MKTLLRVAVFSLSFAPLAGCCCPTPATVPCSQIAEPVAEAAPEPVPSKRVPLPPVESRLSADERVRLALSKKIVKGLSWEEVSLDTALVYLRTITGHKFHVSDKVREEKFDDIVIHAQLDEVSVDDILTVVLTEPFELRWEVRGDVVWILTKQELGGKLRLRYFDVKDLSVGINDFTGNGISDTLAKEKKPEAMKSGDELVDEIRTEVHPTYWDREGVAIEARNGILIVRASPAVLDAIDAFLTLERRRRGAVESGNVLHAKFKKTKISLSVQSETLGGVIRMLQIMTGFNLMIDPRSVAEVKDERITALELKDAPLTTALTMLAESAGDQYVWVYERNMAVLTHKEHVR